MNSIKYKLEPNQVDFSKFTTSYELSKKLKEIGIPQTGYFIWRIMFKNYISYNRKDQLTPIETDVDSFTAAELAIYLPDNISVDGITFHLTLDKWSIKYGIDFHLPKVNSIIFDNDSEANLRAKMIIWLFENKHISIYKCDYNNSK